MRPELAPKLHRRASAWHRTQRDADAAISHAVAAGDLEDAAELIAQYWDRLFQLGQMETILRWIRALGDEAARADARVCLVYAWCALFLGRHDEAEEWRLAASLAPAPQRLYSTMISIEANATALEASQAYMAGNVERALDASRRSVAAHPNDAHFTHWIAKLQLGHALYYAGALDDAADVIEQTLPRLSPERWSVLVVIAYGCLAVIRATQGELEAAGRAAAEAERLVDELQFTEAPWAAQALVGRGKLLDVAGDLAAADTTLARAAVLARRGTRPLVQAHALILLAQIKRRRRDHAGARTAAREARKVLDGCPDSGMLAELLAKVERSLALAPEPSAGEAGGEDELSKRELAVLRLLASPLSQREIGSELFASLNTAKGHVRSVFRKLGVSSRRAAVARGRELGLI